MKLAMNNSMRLTKEEKGFGIWISVAILIALFVGTSMFYGMVAGVVIFSQPELLQHALSADMFQLMSFWLLLAAIVLFVKLSPGRTLKSLGFYKEGLALNLAKGLVFGAGLLGTVYAVNLLMGAVSTDLNGFWSFGLLVLYFLLFFVQSLTEEVMCRGYLMNIIGSRIGLIWGIVINSAVFSVLHFSNPNASVLPAINIFIFGLVFSVLFYLTDNIWLAGAAHAAWNFTLGCIIGSPVSGLFLATSVYQTFHISSMDLYSGGAFGLEGGLICSVVGLAALAILSYFAFKKYKLDDRAIV